MIAQAKGIFVLVVFSRVERKLKRVFGSTLIAIFIGSVAGVALFAFGFSIWMSIAAYSFFGATTLLGFLAIKAYCLRVNHPAE